MLYKKRTRLNLKKYSFTHRCVDLWNSLQPNIIKAKTIQTFENRFDKFLADQAIKHNFKAIVITGHNITYEDDDEELVPQDNVLLPELTI
ncbi:hypothetical protein DPMN_142473 [Dreissena polymorpha]|uniref:Uncharacterized protein n=1 Tax=Dreissena polymorpha TaxID=45954 RepID=A0A9D4JNI0_DREPO|nr:hypothetical protein DPMN_142473 [Dreissena polymorpha]